MRESRFLPEVHAKTRRFTRRALSRWPLVGTYLFFPSWFSVLSVKTLMRKESYNPNIIQRHFGAMMGSSCIDVLCNIQTVSLDCPATLIKTPPTLKWLSVLFLFVCLFFYSKWKNPGAGVLYLRLPEECGLSSTLRSSGRHSAARCG